MPPSSAIDNLVELRQRPFGAYRGSLGVDGDHLPENLGDIVAAVTAFADPVAEDAAENTSWSASGRRWSIHS